MRLSGACNKGYGLSVTYAIRLAHKDFYILHKSNRCAGRENPLRHVEVDLEDLLDGAYYFLPLSPPAWAEGATVVFT